MRIKLTMQARDREASLPIDNHPFAAVIYRLIGAADFETAVLLHEEGVQANFGDRKRFKPFVFSRLQQHGKRVREGRQWLAPGPVEWQIASPIDELMLMLLGALGADPILFIGDRSCGAELEATAATIVPPPQFHERMRFKTLSPLFAAVGETAPDGKSIKHHLRPDDPHFAQAIVKNLCEKYLALTGEAADPAWLAFCFTAPPKPQLVQYAATNHKCCEGVFEIAGPPGLLQLGWECGFGEANSKGFGMVWAVR